MGRHYIPPTKPDQDTHSTSRYNMHKVKLGAKKDQLDGLKALYKEWEEFGTDEFDPYMLHLKRRIRVTENQLRNMRP